jgi:hypothetical protein
MRRIQLYLDDDLWNTLHERALCEGTSISELLRRATRECYLGTLERRQAAMQAFVGIGRDRSDLPDSVEYVRGLRRGSPENHGKRVKGS